MAPIITPRPDVPEVVIAAIHVDRKHQHPWRQVRYSARSITIAIPHHATTDSAITEETLRLEFGDALPEDS